MSVSVDFLYKNYYGLFVNFANKILRDRPAAEDVTQAILIKVSERNLIPDKDISEVIHYMVAGIKKACINYKRDVNVSRKNESAAAVLELQRREDSFDEIANDVILTRVYELVPLLPKKQMEIFILIHFFGMSAVQAAAKLNSNVSTVRVQYKRCITFFRKNIKAPR